MQPPSEATKLESHYGFSEYIGSGKLNGKKAIVTGGEYVFKMGNPIFASECTVIADNFAMRHSSGIGRAVSVLMAREGADITVAFLPEERVDAEQTRKMIEAEGRECHLFAGDLRQHSTCQKVVEDHVIK